MAELARVSDDKSLIGWSVLGQLKHRSNFGLIAFEPHKSERSIQLFWFEIKLCPEFIRNCATNAETSRQPTIDSSMARTLPPPSARNTTSPANLVAKMAVSPVSTACVKATTISFCCSIASFGSAGSSIFSFARARLIDLRQAASDFPSRWATFFVTVVKDLVKIERRTLMSTRSVKRDQKSGLDCFNLNVLLFGRTKRVSLNRLGKPLSSVSQMLTFSLQVNGPMRTCLPQPRRRIANVIDVLLQPSHCDTLNDILHIRARPQDALTEAEQLYSLGLKDDIGISFQSFSARNSIE